MLETVSILAGVLGLAVGALIPGLTRAVKRASLRPSNVLIVLSGARLDILKQVPTERLKFLQLGILVLMSALLATVSMVFALWHGVQLPLPIAIPVALLWGVAVLSLNRYLVASLPTTRSPWTLLLTALPRVTLSVLVSVIITVPIVLQIFTSEISAEIPFLQHQQASAFLAQQQSSPLGQQIAASRMQVQRYQILVAQGGLTNPFDNPAVVSLNQQLAAAQNQRAKDYAQWRCELYGDQGCIPGNGPAAKASQQAYEADVLRVNSLNEQLTSLVQQLTRMVKVNQSSALAAAQKSLATAQAQLNTELHQRTTALNNFNASNSSTGLLVQLRALSALASGNTALSVTRIVILLLFALIDSLPVITQVLLKLGPQSSYDKVLAQDRSVRDSIARQAEMMLRLEVDHAISDLALRYRSAANDQLSANRATSSAYGQATLRDYAKGVRSVADLPKGRHPDLGATVAALRHAGPALAAAAPVAPAELAPFQAEAVPHEDGQLWRLQLSEDEFLLIDSIDGIPTINWTAGTGAKEFASLVSDRLGPPGAAGPTAEMTLSVAGIADQMDARLGVELAFLASPAFDERSEFVRFDDEHVAMALQSMHGDEGAGVKLFGLSSVELDLDMVVSLLARTGTPGLAAHARAAASSPLIKRLNDLARLPAASGADAMSGGGAQ